ncbi:MAG: hypothetical protein RSD49_06570 [Hafnia sp.]
MMPPALPEINQDPLGAYQTANRHAAFPIAVEGYWRPGPEAPAEGALSGVDSNSERNYPWPVIFEPKGYEKTVFIALLKEMEASPFTERVLFRGISMNRLTNEPNGCAEYSRDGWTWPEGYLNYIKLGVPPSRAFYQFVTCIDLDTLPDYGRNRSGVD